MLSVGLTGGIGSGKSEVARRLAGHGAVVVDADQIAREVVAPGTRGLDAVVREFGRQVLRPDGSLDRERLGEIVFADPAKRERLNGIVHPLVGRRAQELFEAAPEDSVVVHDVPLLTENNLASRYDVVVVVDASVDTQVERLARFRGMSEEQARARISAQATREQRLAIADVVIDNDGSPEELDEQVRKLWEDLERRAGRG
ncbi:MAG: dephospho-CoA kinase [Streptosporangiales bacterium]|nr:dephospho-CoA kinase [Streptosporangiales bacterium]